MWWYYTPVEPGTRYSILSTRYRVVIGNWHCLGNEVQKNKKSNEASRREDDNNGGKDAKSKAK